MPRTRRLRRVEPALAAICLLLAGGCTSASPGNGTELPSEEKARLEGLATDLETLRASLGIPGLAAGVVRDGALEWSTRQGAVNLDAALPIGGMTEAFAAVAALRLEERGKLRFDAPVADLPDPGRVRNARLEGPGPGDLGGPRRAAALRLLEGEHVGGGRPRLADGARGGER